VFFIGKMNVAFMCLVASGWWLEGKAHRPPAESEALHGNQQWCNKPSTLDHLSHLFVYRFEWFSYVSISLFYLLISSSNKVYAYLSFFQKIIKL